MRTLLHYSAAAGLTLAAALSITSVGAIAASTQLRPITVEGQQIGSQIQITLPADEADQLIYHLTGTVGRDSLGCSPHFPEGPGNVSN
jgi:hypothetical protein